MIYAILVLWQILPIFASKEDSDMIMYLQMLETSEEKVRFEELVHTYKNLMFYVKVRTPGCDDSATEKFEY